jgi:hypothetical protein
MSLQRRKEVKGNVKKGPVQPEKLELWGEERRKINKAYLFFFFIAEGNSQRGWG